MSEIEMAIKQMKDGKSPGLDNIPVELIKHSSQSTKTTILKLCEKIWKECEWLKDWKKQEFVILYKSGNTKDCNNSTIDQSPSFVMQVKSCLSEFLTGLRQKLN